MTARTHDLIAFASLLTVAAINPPSSLNISTTVTCLIGSVVGALAPDMDQATNRLWDMLPGGNFVGRLLRNLMLRHRTISHSLLGIFLFYQLLNFIIPRVLNPAYVNGQLVTLAIMIGLISHIASDMVTKEGVPLLFPITIKVGIPPFEFLRITTGKFVENFVIFPAVVAYIFWLAVERRETFVNLVRLIQS
jgi:inner membrane protein